MCNFPWPEKKRLQRRVAKKRWMDSPEHVFTRILPLFCSFFRICPLILLDFYHRQSREEKEAIVILSCEVESVCVSLFSTRISEELLFLSNEILLEATSIAYCIVLYCIVLGILFVVYLFLSRGNPSTLIPAETSSAFGVSHDETDRGLGHIKFHSQRTCKPDLTILILLCLWSEGIAWFSLESTGIPLHVASGHTSIFSLFQWYINLSLSLSLSTWNLSTTGYLFLGAEVKDTQIPSRCSCPAFLSSLFPFDSRYYFYLEILFFCLFLDSFFHFFSPLLCLAKTQVYLVFACSAISSLFSSLRLEPYVFLLEVWFVSWLEFMPHVCCLLFLEETHVHHVSWYFFFARDWSHVSSLPVSVSPNLFLPFLVESVLLDLQSLSPLVSRLSSLDSIISISMIQVLVCSFIWSGIEMLPEPLPPLCLHHQRFLTRLSIRMYAFSETLSVSLV